MTVTCSLVLPAAGAGRRLGAGQPKALVLLAGEPLLIHSLRRFAGLVVEAVIPVGAGMAEVVGRAVATAGLSLPVRMVAGGDTRMASVAAGVRATDPRSDLVLIHDAARPLVPRRCILACLASLATSPAAVVAVPCDATVKRVTAGRRVASTIPRDDLWLAQTPQGMRRDLALRAFAAAERDGIACSDDVQAVEHLGGEVAVVPGDPRNLKVTTPADLVLAGLWLAAADPDAG